MIKELDLDVREGRSDEGEGGGGGVVMELRAEDGVGSLELVKSSLDKGYIREL